MTYCEDCASYSCGCPERKELESLRQQLAAALVVCKLKDEAIDLAGGAWGQHEYPFVAINKARDLQPDDSALKAWLGEPVFIRRDQLLKARVAPFLCRLDPIKQEGGGFVPLYSAWEQGK